ncbi:MAG: signal peptide peptidase SppA [Desulfotalea sp.]
MTKLIKICTTFFKFIFKSIDFLRLMTMNVLFWGGLIAIIVILNIKEEQKPSFEKGILELRITGDVVEKQSITSKTKLILKGLTDPDGSMDTPAKDIIKVIIAAANDPKILLMTLDSSKMKNISLNHLNSIGAAINKFQESGKKVLSIQDNYDQKQYYLASYADQICLNPAGYVAIYGFASNKLYYKELLDSLSVDYNVFIVGKYKSALESFTRNSMSDADRAQTSKWIFSLWQQYIDQVTINRKLSSNQLYEYTHKASELLVQADSDPALFAKKVGLVDKILNRHEIDGFVTTFLNTDIIGPEKIHFLDYLNTLPETIANKSNIAVITIEGTIMPGRDTQGVIGSDTVIKQIRQVKEDGLSKGLVLRINSGGGSAFASELIRQELLNYKASGKPLYVSMGSVTASGGYWLSADAEKIFASPSTITGSIGVFGAVPTFKNTLAKIGVSSDGVSTTPIASSLYIADDLSQETITLMNISIHKTYSHFLSIVSNGRSMTLESVEKIAGGQVFDGINAKKVGLIDEFGNLNDSISALAEKIDLRDYNIKYIEPQLDIKEEFLRLLSFNTSKIKLTDYLPISKKISKNIDSDIEIFLKSPDPKGIYAYGGNFWYL